jgi:hypothetical protein
MLRGTGLIVPGSYRNYYLTATGPVNQCPERAAATNNRGVDYKVGYVELTGRVPTIPKSFLRGQSEVRKV